jgi:hypothetical protein
MTRRYVMVKIIFIFFYTVFAQLNAEILCSRKTALLNLANRLNGSALIQNNAYDQTFKQSIPLETTPCWSSQAYSTEIWGAALVNITDDDYPEVITTYESGYKYLYLNNGGIIESTPSWQSNDFDDNVLPAFGDYDNDGDLDMAVACYEFFGGRTKIYQNDNGMLTVDPIWTASSGGGVTCAWGDVDNDGDLDLAIVDISFFPAVFYNNNGTMELIPSWHGTDYNVDFGVTWIDVDNDGDLDLAVGGYNILEPTLRIYYNHDGTLETVASWKSSVTAQYCRGVGLSVYDVNQDGWLDMGVTGGWFENNDVNIMFMNRQDSLENYPSWFSQDVRNSGCCLFGDLNGDGYLDWAVNNGRCGNVYENLGNSIDHTYGWQSVDSGGLGIDLGDVDLDGIVYREDTIVGDGTKKLFYLKIIPIHKLEEITIDSDSVPLSDYCCNLKSGWVSFKDSIPVGSEIVFKYFHSIDIELLLADMYKEKAHLYENTNIGIAENSLEPMKTGLSIYPNPVRRSNPAELTYTVAHPTFVQADLYDCTGRKIETLFKQKINHGLWKEKIATKFSPGTYFLRLKLDKKDIFTKIVIIE